LKALYAVDDGQPKQEMIFDVMLRIIHQEVPEIVVNNPGVDWKLSTNEVTVSPIVDGPIPEKWLSDGSPGDVVSNKAEPNTRYQSLLSSFRSQQMVDPYYPATPTLIDRRFQLYREIPEEEAEALFISLLNPDVMAEAASLVRKRLGRSLRPYDIWYDGFKTRASIGAAVLDSVTREKYPTPEAFEADMPRILNHLGFDDATAQFIAARVKVDPSRGAGHAAGPNLKDGTARLRTRVLEDGMDYKGYNIAAHEFGHNVEQVLSQCKIDHNLLAGVPNTAFTEAFAFVFQDRDMELLGMEPGDPNAGYLHVLDLYWGLCEITAVSLVDMRVWRWMYEHPDATVEELKQAVIGIAQGVWNEFYAPVFGVSDVDILAVYSHMISGAMYLPDYAIGGIIQYQIEDYLKTRVLGQEMERMCTIGSVTPEHWMQNAVGGSISTEPLLAAVKDALSAMKSAGTH
jgi:hypothetical protein